MSDCYGMHRRREQIAEMHLIRAQPNDCAQSLVCRNEPVGEPVVSELSASKVNSYYLGSYRMRSASKL